MPLSVRPIVRRVRSARDAAPRVRAARTGAAALVALGACAHGAHAQDLRWSLTPTAQQVSWDDALGLDNTLLWGGRRGAVLGRRLELQGFWLTNQGSRTTIGDLYDRLGVDARPPGDPGLGVRNYGAALVYNFAVGGWTPFVRAGGSILRFEPEGGSESERIAFSYGGGLRFGKPGGLRFNVFAEDMRFRIDRRLLLALPGADLPPDADVDAQKLRGNLTWGAGISIPFGGGAVTYDDTPQYRLGNVALPVELFAGRLDFAGSSGIPRQYLAGVRTGIDFGPLIGLRGFYWRGTNDDLNRVEGIQGYGGELQFALNAGPGINPYLIAGAGQIDFLGSYDRTTVGGVAVAPPPDQTALILGGGARIPIGSRVSLTASARNWLTARGGATTDVVDASQLRSNWQWGLGLSFGIGGRGNRRAEPPRPRNDTVFVDRATGRRLARTDSAERRDADEYVERFVITARGDTIRGAAVDSVLAADPDARLVTVTIRGLRADSALARSTRARARTLDAERRDDPARTRGYASDRTIEVVVPTEGEIILRYGPPAPAASTPVIVVPPGGAQAAPAAASAPQRQLLREYRDASGRTVREYREPDARVVREYRDGSRLVREWRDPVTDRVRREYVPESRIRSEAGTAPGALPPTAAADARIAPPTTAWSIRKDDRVVDSAGAMTRTGDAAPRATPLASDDVRTIIRDELARERADRDRIERDRIARDRAERDAAIARALRAEPRTEVVTVPGAVDARTVATYREPMLGGVRGGLLYTGGTVNDGTQALLGGRIDLGPISPSLAAVHLVPELAFGFSRGGTSTYLAANAAYEFGTIARFRPRVSLGLGLLNFSGPVGSRDGLEFAVTPSYGVSLPLSAVLGAGRGRGAELVVEHQGLDFFDLNRVIVGIGWRR